MSATGKLSREVERQGAAWSERASSWADLEARQAPVYDEALRRLGAQRGTTVLDVGCGAGTFLRAAADRGARVAGVDAAPGLLDIARTLVPDADLRLGELLALPHPDDTFDVVTGFNAFQFVDDMRAAVREAGRVARPGGLVLIQVWGPPERCDLTVMKDVLRTLRGRRPDGPAPAPAPAPAPPPRSVRAPMWQRGVLEAMAESAGLVPRSSFAAVWTIEYTDEATMVEQMLSSGPVAEAARGPGERVARRAILDALEPFRDAAGVYHLTNEWRFVVAEAQAANAL